MSMRKELTGLQPFIHATTDCWCITIS